MGKRIILLQKVGTRKDTIFVIELLITSDKLFL